MLKWFKVNQFTGMWFLQIVNLEKIFASLIVFKGRKFSKITREMMDLNSDLHLDNNNNKKPLF